MERVCFKKQIKLDFKAAEVYRRSSRETGKDTTNHSKLDILSSRRPSELNSKKSMPFGHAHK
ncbi:hypothetical protein EGR_10752 [Echinococcus granulosus]|uniref:Uncharacterized protein n=1 Tax=Echinococcus granulosus TaxID=6210 RepID=W6TZY2_ECHGR|nr:hypothetical protein EGR_10752 [Echinococcus granulosus]EUB54395.1 hypothetical protein EGR_10752 [Echinococcus granulosus]